MTRRREGKGRGDSIASLTCPSLHCCHITNPSPSHSSRILMSVLAPLTTKARRSRRRGRASRNVRKGRSTRRKEDGDDANAMACSLARSPACLRVSVSCRPWPLVGSLARSTAAGAGPANSTTPAATAAAMFHVIVLPPPRRWLSWVSRIR